MEEDVKRVLKELDEIKKSLGNKKGSSLSEFVIDRLFADKVDIITKTIVGALIFLLFDAFMGGLITLLLSVGGKGSLLFILSPELSEQGRSLCMCPFCPLCFELSGQKESVYQFGFLYLTSWIFYFFKQFHLNKYETAVLVYVFLWAWGKLVYHLRQPVILDKLKTDYVKNLIFEKEDIKLFKKIREVLWEEIENDKKFKKFFDSLKNSGNSNSTNDNNGNSGDSINIEDIKNNDYLFYLLLGRDENLFNQSMSNRTKDADELAFLGTNAFIIGIICTLFYALILSKIFLSTSKIATIIMILLLMFFSAGFRYFSFGKKFSFLEKGWCTWILWIFTIVLILIGVVVLSYSSQDSKLIAISVAIFFGTLTPIIVMSIYYLTLQSVARRFISRNQRLYINYLIPQKSTDEE